MDIQSDERMVYYHVTARNLARESENRIHDDEVAKSYGFKGGLVPGVSIYAYMTYPIVSIWGKDWLERGRAHLFLHRPVLDGDKLTVSARVDAKGEVNSMDISAIKPDGTKCATCNATLPEKPEPLFNGRNFQEGDPLKERIPISWDAVMVGKPLAPLLMNTYHKELKSYATDHGDSLDIYHVEGGAIHPGFLLHLSNRVFSSNFILNPWLHVESFLQNFKIARSGSSLKVLAIPSEKFEKKGNQFVRLNVQVLSGDGQLIQQVIHTAIFRIRR